MPKRLVVDDETDDAVEVSPHIRLVLGVPAQEHRARTCFLGQRPNALDADLPPEAVEPAARDGVRPF